MKPEFTGQVILRPTFAPRPGISHVLFDFDGTLSLIRQGWPEVMVPMFTEVLPALPGESLDDRGRLARRRVAPECPFGPQRDVAYPAFRMAGPPRRKSVLKEELGSDFEVNGAGEPRGDDRGPDGEGLVLVRRDRIRPDPERDRVHADQDRAGIDRLSRFRSLCH